jgi:hypothetical protein
MDAKSLREAMKSKARRLAGASSTKLDSSDFTPAELLNADVKTGMRPISRRAFKSGGKVDGEEAKSNASRTPRGNIGLANTNQRVANEERDGKKHVGGFARGGSAMKKAAERDIGEYVSGEEMPSYKAKSAGRKALKEMSTAEVRKKMGSNRNMERPPSGLPDMQDLDDRENDPRKFKKGGRTAKYIGGSAADPMSVEPPTEAPVSKYIAKRKDGGRTAKMDGGTMRPMARPADLEAAQAIHRGNRAAMNSDAPAKMGYAPETSIRPKARAMNPEEMKNQEMLDRAAKYGQKKGGKVEGSAKDMAEDKAMAKKHGVSMKDWEKSDADKKHDKACGGGVAGRTARKSGGKVGKTNINIIISPSHSVKPGAPTGMEAGIPKPPMPMPGPAMPPAGGPPMPMPMHAQLPPGLGAALAGAAGGMPPGGPGGMPLRPPMPGPMMARKSGGKVVYPITGGAGGGKARKEKVDAYGETMNKDLKK